MATKAELQEAFDRYRNSCGLAARAESARALHDALVHAEASLPHLHAAVTYQRRFRKNKPLNTYALDCILRYAPVLFRRRALDQVEQWYLGGTRTERAALSELPARIQNSRLILARATELWSVLAATPGALLVVDARDSVASIITAAWVTLGAVAESRRSGRAEYVRVSDPQRPTQGKCSGCGQPLAVPLARLLEPFPCPHCRQPREFVITGRIA